MFSNRNGFNSKYISVRYLSKVPNILKLNSALLYNLWLKKEIKREIRKSFKLRMKAQHIKFRTYSQSRDKNEVDSFKY